MKRQSQTNQAHKKLELIQDKSEIFCYHCGSKNYVKNGSSGVRKKYRCNDCQRSFLAGIKVKNKSSKGMQLGEDVWHANELGLRVNQHKNETKLIFIHIKQDWLKEAAKKYIKYHATTKQLATLQKFLTGINLFSKFISERQPNLTWETIKRITILDYLTYLNSRKLKWDTKKNRITSLKQLFETGKINSWFNIPSYLIRSEDYPKKQKRVPRYIPEEVMAQLNQHLDSLPKPVMSKNELAACQTKLIEANPKVTPINQKTKKSILNYQIHDELKTRLSNLGVRLNATLKKIITSSTQQEINNAVSAVEEYLATNKKVKSKAGLLRKALEEGWIPNLTDEERQLSEITDTFSKWFKLAKEEGLVQASQGTKDGILVMESTGEWTPLTTMLEKGWTLEYLQQRSKQD